MQLSFAEFCKRFDVPLFPWQRQAFGAATQRRHDRFVYPLAGVSAPRGDGKSHGSAAVGVWRLVAGPPGCDIISSALDLDGARITLDHARAIIRRDASLADAIDIRANALLYPANDARWTITSREHTASRGRHPHLVLMDEAGWLRDDELFASLLAAQASVPDPLFLVTSTVGRRQAGPLWTIKHLAESGAPHVFWHWHGENKSPKVTKAYLERQRRVLMPAVFAREHQNLWTDGEDAFTSAAEVDAAMSHGWTQQHVGERGRMYEGFVDLGLVNDPTVIALGHADGALVFIDLLWTLQGSRAKPVQLVDVEAAVKQLSERFQVRRWRIESWQGVQAAQSLQRLGLPVELFAPTAKANAEEWPTLAQKLSSRTIVLPKHERLREELLNLTVDLGPHGVRLIDRGKVHQDHAVAIRGVVAGLTMARHLASPEFIAACLAAGSEVASPWASAPLATVGMGNPQDVQDDD
jgi:phage terminase large subunit-like protein